MILNEFSVVLVAMEDAVVVVVGDGVLEMRLLKNVATLEAKLDEPNEADVVSAAIEDDIKFSPIKGEAVEYKCWYVL